MSDLGIYNLPFLICKHATFVFVLPLENKANKSKIDIDLVILISSSLSHFVNFLLGLEQLIIDIKH